MGSSEKYRAVNRSRYLPSDYYIENPEEPSPGEADPEMCEPSAFPPGTSGFASGPEPPQPFVDWLRSYDPLAVVGWQPVTLRWVLWRKGADGDFRCMFACENPFKERWGDLDPGEAMRSLDRRIKAIIVDSDPSSYDGSARMCASIRAKAKEQESRGLQRGLEILKDAREDARKFVQIKNIGRGNKFSTMYR